MLRELCFLSPCGGLFVLGCLLHSDCTTADVILKGLLVDIVYVLFSTRDNVDNTSFSSKASSVSHCNMATSHETMRHSNSF